MYDLMVTIKRSVFPLSKFYLTIDNERYSIRPGEVKKIKLPGEKVYEIYARSYWLNKKESLFLKNQSVLSIRHIIPDIYYLIGFLMLISIVPLTFFGLFNALLLSGIVLIYLIPTWYFTLIKRDNYFKIKVKPEK